MLGMLRQINKLIKWKKSKNATGNFSEKHLSSFALWCAIICTFSLLYIYHPEKLTLPYKLIKGTSETALALKDQLTALN